MKILIADDHALFREGMSYILGELAESVALLEAADCETALRYAAEHSDLDLVLLDLNMPDLDGFTALDLFSTHYPALQVVILSASKQRTDMKRALNGGAFGFIPKDTTSAVMLNALRLVLSGGVYVPSTIALSEEKILKAGQPNQQEFTPRQLETLRLLAKGHSNKDIARVMNLAEGTVKMHITAIFKCLGVSNRTQAVLAAEKLNLVSKEINS